MNKAIIEKELRTWFQLMTKIYGWLRIKFEFNEGRRVFMVSFSPISQIELSDAFNLEVMRFEDKLNDTYGDEAPLFTDEETLFQLSSNAEVIEAYSFTSVGNPLTSEFCIAAHMHNTIDSWARAVSSTTAKTGNNFRQTTTEASYAYAA